MDHSHGCRTLKNQKVSWPGGRGNYRSSILLLYIVEGAVMAMQMHCRECLVDSVDALVEILTRSSMALSA